MFFRWGCKNWHVAKLLHPIPTQVNSLGLQCRKYICCEHQWECSTTLPTEQQTRQWEIGSSTLCSVVLPTHGRLGNAGRKIISSKFQWLLSYTKHSQGMSDISQRKVLIHMYLLIVPRDSSAALPKLLYWSRLSWKHLSPLHYFTQRYYWKQFLQSPRTHAWTERCDTLPCFHSDRLFGGYLRTCQHVILLTPFKNLSLVGISFSMSWIFLHTLVVT